jgi:enamine deaminase RidA (YjgF/YER057c/UK114 family)
MKMNKQLINSGSTFEKNVSFSRAVVVDNMVFVSGCTGYDYKTMTISDDVAEQTEQTFQNIIWALAQANASLEDVVRVTYMVPNPDDFEKCWPVIKKHFGTILPACIAVCSLLISDAIKIEIEVTAIKSTK